jgi:class 3 adenylate cyclase
MTEPPDAPTPDASDLEASAPDALGSEASALDASGSDASPPDNSASDDAAPEVPAPDESASDDLVPEVAARGDDSTLEDPPSVAAVDRRLAAILFADVAGYTELSSHDEDLALGLIKSFQRISRKIVGDKGGRVVKFLGDGMLAEFSSLDAAVNAAHALQNSFPYLDEVIEAHVSLRVGVHLGDIVFGEDGDVYGSGVNVASRIEGHAPLAGVVVSDSAY